VVEAAHGEAVGLVVEVFLLEVHIVVEVIEVVEEDMHRTRKDLRMRRPTHNYETGKAHIQLHPCHSET
jgi:hypothetical protein